MAEYFNHEHYPDPTAYSVMRDLELEEKKRQKIATGEWFMRWVYVASPFKGDMQTNIQNAKMYALYVANQAFVPMVPHLFLTQFLNDDIQSERELGLALGLQILKRCHELWVFGGIVSEGMSLEIRFARRHNIPIRYFDINCKEVSKYGD